MIVPVSRTTNSEHTVKQRRVDEGWTQADLADLLGCHPSYVALVETGRRNPSPAMRVRLAHVFGCRVADLFDPPPRLAADEFDEAAS
jgi:transcriptional regulator with XRE-family HTH domain